MGLFGIGGNKEHQKSMSPEAGGGGGWFKSSDSPKDETDSHLETTHAAQAEPTTETVPTPQVEAHDPEHTEIEDHTQTLDTTPSTHSPADLGNLPDINPVIPESEDPNVLPPSEPPPPPPTPDSNEFKSALSSSSYYHDTTEDAPSPTMDDNEPDSDIEVPSSEPGLAHPEVDAHTSSHEETHIDPSHEVEIDESQDVPTTADDSIGDVEDNVSDDTEEGNEIPNPPLEADNPDLSGSNSEAQDKGEDGLQDDTTTELPPMLRDAGEEEQFLTKEELEKILEEKYEKWISAIRSKNSELGNRLATELSGEGDQEGSLFIFRNAIKTDTPNINRMLVASSRGPIEIIMNDYFAKAFGPRLGSGVKFRFEGNDLYLAGVRFRPPGRPQDNPLVRFRILSGSEGRDLEQEILKEFKHAEVINTNLVDADQLTEALNDV